MKRLIEGTDVAGRRVLVVEDTSTTGASPSTAVEAAREAGATVVGVATVVDRDTGADAVIIGAISYDGLNNVVEEIRAKDPVALVLSGGPASVYSEDAPSIDPAVFELGLPVFGICRGLQLINVALGGTLAESS